MTAIRGRPPTGKAKALTGIRLTSPCRQWYADTMGNRYSAIAYVVEAWPALYESTLADIKANGVLGRSEAALLQSAMAGVRLDAGLAGQHIVADVQDAEAEGEDVSDLVSELSELPRITLAVLELWATTPGVDTPERLEEHLSVVC